MKSKKMKWLAVVLVLCLIAAGAAIFWQVNRQQEPSLEVISRKDALEDYDYLWQTLEDNYPFFGVAERKYGLDVQQLKQEYRAKLESMGEEIDFLEFYQLMGKCTGTLKGLGHFHFYTPDSYLDERRDAEHAMEVMNQTSNPLLEKRIEYYTDTEVSRRYEFLRQSGEQSGGNSKQNEETSPNVTMERKNESVAYLKIKSFSSEYLGEESQKELADFFSQNADAPYLIIDVRGNPGGYGKYWTDYLVAPNITELTYDGYLYLTPYGEASEPWMKIDGQDSSNLISQLDEIYQLPKINQDDLKNIKYYGKGAFLPSPRAGRNYIPDRFFY